MIYALKDLKAPLEERVEIAQAISTLHNYIEMGTIIPMWDLPSGRLTDWKCIYCRKAVHVSTSGREFSFRHAEQPNDCIGEDSYLGIDNPADISVSMMPWEE